MDERIYIGINEICDTTLLLSKGFRELGFEVTNVVVDQSDTEFLPYGREGYRPHDRYIDWESDTFYTYELTKEFLKQTPRHDVFIFNAGRSFYHNLAYNNILKPFAYGDIPLLKMLGKKVGVISTGSDIRSYNQLIKDVEDAGLYTHKKYLEEFVKESNPIDEAVNRTRAEKIQKYSDCVFTRPNMAQHLQDYNLYNVPIDIGDLEFRDNNRNNPHIIHAPSNRATKGTKYVCDAIEKLREEGYDFKFELVEDLPNREFRKKLTHSDIVIDQLILPGHGLLAVEAMATGNAVVGSAVPGFNGHPEEVPIMTAAPDTIYERLRYLIENEDEKNNLISRGRKYVKNHHDYMDVARDILDGLNIDYS